MILSPPHVPRSSSEERVRDNTSDRDNRRIARLTEERLVTIAGGTPGAIERRLLELDGEWDIERMLEANAATVVIFTTALAMAEDRRWALVTFAVGAFLLQHAVQGWCPPLPVLRRLGFRTAGEIHEERLALRILRGDFDSQPVTGPEALQQAQEP
jgi:hypothetical protein